PGVSDALRREEDLRSMLRSQNIAAAVALRALGYKVVARPTGALITEVLGGSPAAGKLRPTDVVVAVGGRPVRTVPDLRRLIGSHRPGDSLTLTVRTGHDLHTVRIKTIADPENPKRPIIGVIPDQAADIHLPFPVHIDAQGI